MLQLLWSWKLCSRCTLAIDAAFTIPKGTKIAFRLMTSINIGWPLFFSLF